MEGQGPKKSPRGPGKCLRLGMGSNHHKLGLCGRAFPVSGRQAADRIWARGTVRPVIAQVNWPWREQFGGQSSRAVACQKLPADAAGACGGGRGGRRDEQVWCDWIFFSLACGRLAGQRCGGRKRKASAGTRGLRFARRRPMPDEIGVGGGSGRRLVEGWSR